MTVPPERSVGVVTAAMVAVNAATERSGRSITVEVICDGYALWHHWKADIKTHFISYNFPSGYNVDPEYTPLWSQRWQLRRATLTNCRNTSG